MPRYLINEREAKALRDVVDLDKLSESLGFDKKHPRPSSNFPFRFKLLEAMGASTPNKANASIYFFGDGSTEYTFDTDNVVDDSSMFSGASSGDKGICVAAEEYYITEMLSKKPCCRFTVNAAFTTSDFTVLGVIATTDQYGVGLEHFSTIYTFKNMKTHSSLYEFYGDAGDAGLACYSGTSDVWYIKMFECP